MTTHDYSAGHRGWGHDYVFRPSDDTGQEATAQGWGRGIEDGDFLLLDNGGQPTRYYVESINYYRDPPDMWSAKLLFAPRPSNCPDCGEPDWEMYRVAERNFILRKTWKCGHFREAAA